MATILVVDDDQDLTGLLRYALEREGFTVRTTHSGREGVRMVRADAPDLIVLDVTMPDMSGFNVLSVLRTFSRVPVVMLTGRGQEEDMIVGFGHGADDYVAKPFNVQVLVARIKAILRRTTYRRGMSAPYGRSLSAPCGRSYHLGGAVFHPDAHEIVGQDVSIKLTPTESHILHLLLAHAGRALSTERLMEQMWGYDVESQPNVIKTHISYLRAKLARLPQSAQLIQTVPGVGYVVRHTDENDTTLETSA